jgi:hypothetical protein
LGFRSVGWSFEAALALQNFVSEKVRVGRESFFLIEIYFGTPHFRKGKGSVCASWNGWLWCK